MEEVFVSVSTWWNSTSLRRISIVELGLYLFVAFWCGVAVGTSDTQMSRRVLDSEGYDNIRVVKAPFTVMCPHWWQVDRTVFHAVDASGRETSGLVCGTINGKYNVVLDDSLDEMPL